MHIHTCIQICKQVEVSERGPHKPSYRGARKRPPQVSERGPIKPSCQKTLVAWRCQKEAPAGARKRPPQAVVSEGISRWRSLAGGGVRKSPPPAIV